MEIEKWKSIVGYDGIERHSKQLRQRKLINNRVEKITIKRMGYSHPLGDKHKKRSHGSPAKKLFLQ